MNISEDSLFQMDRPNWKSSIWVRKFGSKINLTRRCTIEEVWWPTRTDPEQYLFKEKGLSPLEFGQAVRLFLNLRPNVFCREDYSSIMKSNSRYLNADVAIVKTPTMYPSMELHTYTDDAEAIGAVGPNMTLSEYYLLEKRKVPTNQSRYFKTLLPESDEELGELVLKALQYSVDWKIPVPPEPDKKKNTSQG